jgi:heterodisulfide reductase subunit C
MTTSADQLSGGFAREIEIASGASVLRCYPCQKCSSGCPIAGASDLKPHELARLIQFGAREEALSSRFIWECTSCETCATRCPQGVELAAAVDVLRRMARGAGEATGDTTVPTFNDIFLAAVRRLGRVHEFSLLAVFKLRTRSFAQDVAKLPMMLWKGKLQVLPKCVRGRAIRERIFARTRKQPGGSQ